MREIAVTTLRIQIDYPACDRFFNPLSSSLRISKIAARHTRHATRLAVMTVPTTVAPSTITRSAISISITISITIVATIVT